MLQFTYMNGRVVKKSTQKHEYLFKTILYLNLFITIPILAYHLWTLIKWHVLPDNFFPSDGVIDYGPVMFWFFIMIMHVVMTLLNFILVPLYIFKYHPEKKKIYIVLAMLVACLFIQFLSQFTCLDSLKLISNFLN